jgi:hypothetical protein
MVRKINWFGLVAGIVTLVMLVLSLYMPWWQLTIGQNLVKINASPVYMNFGFFGSQFTIPLIWALNVITILTFTACGLLMLIYSLAPTKPYAKQLLQFSYRKPLYTLVAFVVILVAVVLGLRYFGVSFPLNGSTTLTLPSNWTLGTTVSALVSGYFELPFWFAIAAAALCLGARIYHGHILQPLIKPEATANPTATAATESLS